MSQEIERKFLIKTMPDLSELSPVTYERGFLHLDKTCEIRVQRKGKNYELERKSTLSNLEASKQKLKITETEYNTLIQKCDQIIMRESYLISQNPEISIKIYSGMFSGLSRVEVEFQTKQEASHFIPFDWFGKEIIDSPLGRDSRLIGLSSEKFTSLTNS